MKRHRWTFAALSLLLGTAGCILEEYEYGPPPLTPREILEFHRKGWKSDEILREIDRAGMDRHLSTAEIEEMKKAGVPTEVIQVATDAPVRRYVPAPARRRYVHYDPWPAEFIIDIGWTAAFWSGHTWYPRCYRGHRH